MTVQLRLRRRPQRPSDDYSEPSESSYNDYSNQAESSDDWQPETPDVVAPTKPPRYVCLCLYLTTPPVPTIAIILWFPNACKFPCAAR